VLQALVCRSLVELGMSQVGAAGMVIGWAANDRDPRRLADVNRKIWKELGLPPVAG
jgi:hypothetical protein